MPAPERAQEAHYPFTLNTHVAVRSSRAELADGSIRKRGASTPALLNDGVADQPVDELRHRAHRHTPAAADVDRLELTTGHQLVDGRSSDRQPAGGLFGRHEQLVAGGEGLVHEGLRADSHSAGPSVVTRRTGSGVISTTAAWVAKHLPAGSRLEEKSLREGDDSCAAHASAQAELRMRIAWRHPTPSLWHTRSTTSPVWPQPMQCQMPSSRFSCKEGERSKWPWEASRATPSRLWRARAASMVARCRVVRDGTDVG